MNRHISTIRYQTPNPARAQIFTVNFFNTRITTVVTSTAAVARQWVYNIRNNHGDALYDSTLVVGLGVQWRPTFNPYSDDPPPAATLQLCVGTSCLIFQLTHAYSIPATLSRLLDDERVTFVGVHNGRDRELLEDTFGELELWDLVDMAKEEGYGNWSMGAICGDVLGLHGIVKPRVIGLSDWEAFWLSNHQVQYATVDAHISYLLGVAFGYPKRFDDDCDDGEDYDDDEDDYEDYTNPYHYDSNWNYVGY